MADAIVPIAFTGVRDSANKYSEFAIRVGVADAQAYVAAANDAARLATDVGVLLNTVEILFLGGDTAVEKRGVRYEAVNDGFTPVDPEAEIYNSNKLNVHYTAFVAGLNRGFIVTIPQRDPADYVVNTDGITVTQGLGDAIDNFVTAFSNTGLSLYGTAISPVMSIDVNDQ
jgi:hypothetical protein